jgi:TonB family protein
MPPWLARKSPSPTGKSQTWSGRSGPQNDILTPDDSEGLHLEYGKTPTGYTLVVPTSPDTAWRRPPGKIYSELLLTFVTVIVFLLGCATGQTDAKGSSAQNTLTRAEVTLRMQWQRGDPHDGPNFIRLHEACQNSEESGCQCRVRFALNSAQFADYISSFDGDKVPVVYEVVYGENGQARAARFLSAGTWARDRFPSPNDGLLGVEFSNRSSENRGITRHRVSLPADCFPPTGSSPSGNAPNRQPVQASSKDGQPQAQPPQGVKSEVPKPFHLPRKDAEALLIKKMEPEYPQEALDQRIQGTVLLRTEISEAGKVTNLTLISGHPRLAPAAIEAVKQWMYQPYLQDGRAVAFETQVQVDFRLPSK